MAENLNREYEVMGGREQQQEVVSRSEQSSVTSNPGENQRSSHRRGLASADQATRQRVASQGGRAAHAKGTAHEWTSEEAREAGRKGGKVVSQDRQHMSEIGRKGGLR
jgi:general stress protein YciG